MSDMAGSSKKFLNSAGGPLRVTWSAISTSTTVAVLVLDSIVVFVGVVRRVVSCLAVQIKLGAAGRRAT